MMPTSSARGVATLNRRSSAGARLICLRPLRHCHPIPSFGDGLRVSKTGPHTAADLAR